MRIYLDERCLAVRALEPMLEEWLKVYDFIRTTVPVIALYLDRLAVRDVAFIKRYNADVRPDKRALCGGMLFGSAGTRDWRLEAVALGTVCQLVTETVPVTDSSVCEAYEHLGVVATTGLWGHQCSSYVRHVAVEADRLSPASGPRVIPCGTAFPDIRRLAIAWGCIPPEYDTAATTSPKDYETILGWDSERFVRVGRFERNGRRQVYREQATGRFFYVDNLHYGGGAHLEVFDPNEHHLGKADLQGNLIPSTRVQGRTISW
ncbi:MAG TPA: hypothetical protein DCQ33_16250 [Nitrospira sp.]|nr:hypothetical protein [Nitrospira sp.]